MTKNLRLALTTLTFLVSLSAAADYSWPSDREWGKPFAGSLEGRADPGELTLCNNDHGFPAPTPGRECVPEVTYSWGSARKADALFKGLEKSADWNVSIESIDPTRIALFTALSPVSTFLYGAVPLRIKFRPGTTFQVYSTEGSFTGEVCRRIRKRKRDLTTPVFLVEKPLPTVPGARFYEIVLCHFDAIESISRATREHYDETLRDLYRLDSRDPQRLVREKTPTYSYIQYRDSSSPYPLPLMDPNFRGRPFLQHPDGVTKERLDDLPLNDSVLTRHLSAFYESARDGSTTQILYNPTLTTPPSHFEWKRPLWFSR